MRISYLLRITAIALGTWSLVNAQIASSQAPSSEVTAPAPIPAARIAKIEEMLTLTMTKPSLVKDLAEEREQLTWYAHVQTSTLTEVPQDKRPKEQEITAGYSNEMAKIAESQLIWEKLRPSIIRFCADNFTDEQMDSIISFYKSPVGKLILEKGQALNKTSYAASHSLQGETKYMTDQATMAMQTKVESLRPSPARSSTTAPAPAASPVRSR